MVNVIKRREGRKIEYDITKICEAITKAFAAVEEIDEMVEETIEKLRRALLGNAYKLAHCAIHTFFKIKSQIKSIVCYDPHMGIWLTIIICILVKILTESFLAHAHVLREIWTARTQERGTDGDSDSDAMYIVFRNYIPVESL